MDCRDKIVSNDYADVIVDFDLEEAVLTKTVQDYCYQRIDETLRIYYVNRAQIPEVSVSDYRYQYLPKCYGLMQEETDGNNTGGMPYGTVTQFDTVSLSEAGILQVQNPPLSLTGLGCAVAIIDTGIDYTNEVFRRADGTSRILAIWDQTDQSGEPPEGFLYGTEYTREQINEALLSNDPYSIVPTRDVPGLHGTKIASIAAGSVLDGGYRFVGAAPDADIIVVKLKGAKQYLRDYYIIPDSALAYAENDIITAFAYAQSFAITFDRPISMCFGLGTNMGDHSGSSALARYMDKVSVRRNIGILTAAGNEGNAAHHFRGIINEDNPERTLSAEIRVGRGNNGFIAEIWGTIPNFFRISIRSPGGEEIRDFSFQLYRSMQYNFVYDKTVITADTLLVEQSSGQELVFLRLQNPTPGIWTITVRAEDVLLPAIFDIWLPISEFLNTETYFLAPTPNETLTSPSTAGGIMTVSAYNDESGGFSIGSSRGYTRSGQIKPDFSAPGVRVPSVSGTLSGTSAAAALACGGVAQFLQWAVIERRQPLINGSEIKNYFIRGARRDPSLKWPNREEGFGKMNMEGIFRELSR